LNEKGGCGEVGEWLLSDYSIADAMFVPIAIRFSGYNIHLSDVEVDYVESVIKQPGIVYWVVVGKKEKEFIEKSESETYKFRESFA